MATKPKPEMPKITDFPALQIVEVEREEVVENPVERTIRPDFVDSVWVEKPAKKNSAAN